LQLGGYGRRTGDFTDDDEALMRGRYEICLMT
jgi:hypothetical protein